MQPEPPLDAIEQALLRRLGPQLDATADVYDVEPSPGFVASVMEAVRAEATAAPPPITFSWRRALPGMVAGVAALRAFFLFVVRSTFMDGSKHTAALDAASVDRARTRAGLCFVAVGDASSEASEQANDTRVEQVKTGC